MQNGTLLFILFILALALVCVIMVVFTVWTIASPGFPHFIQPGTEEDESNAKTACTNSPRQAMTAFIKALLRLFCLPALGKAIDNFQKLLELLQGYWKK